MRRKVFYRHLNKTNNNLYKYQFYGVSAEDLALYLYNLGIEKETFINIEILQVTKSLINVKEENKFLNITITYLQ